MIDRDSGSRTTFASGAFDRMTMRVRQTLASSPAGFPNYADPTTGTWTTSPDGFWTGGFWVGELWLAGHVRHDETLLQAAREWLVRLRGRVESRSIFRAFLFYYGAVLGAVLERDETAEQLAIATARSLVATFDAKAGLMPLGVEAEEAHTVGEHESNIDGLIATPMLLWAAARNSNEEMRQIALSHARRNAELCVRPDGSVVQSASFDRTDGQLVRRYTHKGYGDESVWTRAQAWAMLGYSLSARFAPDQPWLLSQAVQVCDWWIANAPSDLVAYWDFDAPKTPETWRDTSGTAIAAASLLKVAALLSDAEKALTYRDFAIRTVAALVGRHLTPADQGDRRVPGILADGCFDPRNGTAVSHELIWGDYFLMESLAVLSERLKVSI